MTIKNPSLVDRLKLILASLESKNDENKLSNFKITNGYDAITTLKQFIAKYSNKFYIVVLTYEILSGKDRKYYRTNTFRTITFQNVHSQSGASNEGILGEIESFIFEKGEIYFPEDPYKISFEKISITALNKTFRRKERTNRLKERCFSAYGILRLERVHGLIDALSYVVHKQHPSLSVYISMPVGLKQLGFTSMTQYDELDLDDQIRIFNQLKLTRKNSFFQHKTIKLYNNKEKAIQEWTPDPEIVYLYMSTDLYVIVLDPLDNVNIEGPLVKVRNIRPISDAIYVIYDTEWSWDVSNTDRSITTPQLLTYCIVNLSSYLSTDPAHYTYQTEYILGQDCVIKFLEILVNLVNKYKHRKIYAIAHNASDIEHTFIIGAITKWFEKSPNYELHFRHVQGSHIKSLIWRTIEFRDSLLFIPLALKDIGRALQLDVQKLEIDPLELQQANYDDPNFETSEQGKRIIQYAMMDSLVLAKAIIKFVFLIKEALGGHSIIDIMQFLSASSIIKWWLIVPDDEISWDGPDISKFRNTIFLGGRNECFFIGTDKDFLQIPQYKSVISKKRSVSKPISLDKPSPDTVDRPNSKAAIYEDVAYAMSIDVTSSYPYNMCQDALPGNPVSVTKIELFQQLMELLANPEYIYGVYGKLKMKQPMKIPLIGIKQNNKLIFPNFISGDYAAFMWDFEILAIFDNIENITDITVITFKKYTKIQPKIKQLFEGRKLAKQQGNEGLAFVYKILMNSGYGSLGLNYMREHAYLAKGTFLKNLLALSPKFTTYEGPNGFTWVIRVKESEVNSKIFMASYITAKARHLLWTQLMYLTNEEHAIILYCDTDSIIFVDRMVKEAYYAKKYTGTELGSWKFEGVAKSWEIATLKVYRLGTKIKYKGITSSDTSLLDNTGRITKETEIEIWTINRNASIKVKNITKKMSLAYTKGFVMPNGIVIPPMV